MRLDIAPEALTRWVELPPIGAETPAWRAELVDGLLRTWEGDWSREVAEDALDHGLAARDPDALSTLQLWPGDGPANATVQLSVHAAPPVERLVDQAFPGDDVVVERLDGATVGPGYEVVWMVTLPDGAQGIAARHAFTDGETLLLVTLDVTHPLFAASILETVRDLARGIVVEHDDGTPWQAYPLLEHVVVDEQVEGWAVVPIDAEADAS